MAKGELVVIPMISGIEEDVEASLINATFQVKDATAFKFPHPEFGAWLIEEIYVKQKINAKKEGLFKKKYVCSSCQSELNPESQARGMIEFEIKYPFMELAPFQVRLTLPLVTCGNCKKKNVVDVKGVYDFRVPEALLHAFESRNIKP
jgi:hypothetical protein